MANKFDLHFELYSQDEDYADYEAFANNGLFKIRATWDREAGSGYMVVCTAPALDDPFDALNGEIRIPDLATWRLIVGCDPAVPDEVPF